MYFNTNVGLGITTSALSVLTKDPEFRQTRLKSKALLVTINCAQYFICIDHSLSTIHWPVGLSYCQVKYLKYLLRNTVQFEVSFIGFYKYGCLYYRNDWNQCCSLKHIKCWQPFSAWDLPRICLCITPPWTKVASLTRHVHKNKGQCYCLNNLYTFISLVELYYISQQ